MDRAAAIPRFIAGVQPLEPGFAIARIAPAPGSLQFFRAKVPTIRGPVHVEYQRLDKGYRLRLVLPGNCPAQLLLPQISAGAAAAITLDNQIVKPRAEAGRLIIDALPPGEHLIVVSMQ
jgi:hypothetical protein